MLVMILNKVYRDVGVFLICVVVLILMVVMIVWLV